MIKLVSFSLLFASIVQAAPIVKSATNTLEIKLQDDNVEVQLPETAFKALTQWNPEFVVFNKKDYSKSILELFNDLGKDQMPMAFIDDLDGNEKKDIVLFGSDLKNQYVIALLQRDKKWTLVKVAEWSIKDIKNSVIPSSTVASATAADKSQTKETGVPIYVLPAQGEQATKLKEKKKVGIQVETYMGNGDVYEIKNNKPVKFTL
ncbi:hypothetical protein [Pseudobdellovibrio sp. HCB154]|uniref:hypothetical protein n=1 Tax=Pseudobdellovibrio sp. HCB154 TaxID=3386277 RepID=UPI00391749E1